MPPVRFLRWVFAALLAAALRAQTPSPAPVETTAGNAADGSGYVLKTFVNLVQVPTLVLSPTLDPLPLRLPPSAFNISLDGGPRFHPTKMHIEGNEPIHLSVLVDASGSANRLLPGLADAFAALVGDASDQLHHEDHVSLYALDCSLVHTLLDHPADASSLRSGLTSLLDSPSLHRDAGRGTCEHRLRLRDTEVYVGRQMADSPARRVLLVISSGRDGKSTLDHSSATSSLQIDGVSVFGLRDVLRLMGDVTPAKLTGHATGIYFVPGPDEFPFNEMVMRTGGVILTTERSELEKSLRRFVSILRGRYILEFPRAQNATAGGREVGIDITVPSRSVYLVTTGVTVALPNAEETSGENTVHGTDSPAVVGNRHAPRH